MDSSQRIPIDKGAACRSADLGSNAGMESHDRTTARLDALEIKASYTDDLLDELNLTVYRQQQQIDSLRQQLAQLRQQLPEPGAGTGSVPRDELPPHY